VKTRLCGCGWRRRSRGGVVEGGERGRRGKEGSKREEVEEKGDGGGRREEGGR